MREHRPVRSMSGNRKLNQVKPDCGGAAQTKSINNRETTAIASVLDCTLNYTNLCAPAFCASASLLLWARARNRMWGRLKRHRARSCSRRLPNARIH